MCCPNAAHIKPFTTVQTNQRYSAFKPIIAFVTVTLTTPRKDSWLEFLHFNEKWIFCITFY